MVERAISPGHGCRMRYLKVYLRVPIKTAHATAPQQFILEHVQYLIFHKELGQNLVFGYPRTSFLFS